MTMVFPVPAPPNTADLPPFRKGQMRSMTFMPVSKISACVDWSVNGGGSRWIGSRRSPFTGPLPSIGSPMTLKSRPSVASPTGTVIGPPAATAFIPRRRPSVAAVLALDDERVVDLGEVALFELDVEDRADDLDDPSGVRRLFSGGFFRRYGHLSLPLAEGLGPRCDLEHLFGDS